MAQFERKVVLEEPDEALTQRHATISERNNTLLERDNAIAALCSLESVVSIQWETKCMDHLLNHPANGAAVFFYQHQKKFLSLVP